MYLIDLYFSKFPQPRETLDFFNLKPLAAKPDDPTKPWFQATPIGKNTLGKFVENMCIDAGVEKKTNHSLRATGASAMFAAGVPEKLIKSVTGHKSSKALEIYERPTVKQLKAVSKVMANPGSSFIAEMDREKVQCHSDSVDVFQSREILKEKSDYGIVGSMFAGLNSCPINISPQTMVINIQQPANTAVNDTK